MNLKPFLVIALLIMYGSSPTIVFAQENPQQPSWSWVNPEGGSDVGYQTKQSSAAAMQVSCVVCPELTVERLKAVSQETVTYEYSSEPVDPVPSGDWLYPLMGLSHALPLPDFSTLFSTEEAQEANHEAIHYDAFEGSCGDNFIDATGPWQPIESNADGHQGSYWAGAPLSFFAQYVTLSEGETLAGIEEHYQLKRGFWQALVPTVGCTGIGSFDGEIAFPRVRALVCVEPYSEVFEGRCILPEKATVTGPNDTGCDETEANPCNPATGDKVDAQTDISFSGLSFTRFYSSLRGASDTGLGENWSHNYHKRLIGGNTDSEPVSLQFGAGKQFALEFVGHEAINVGVNELGDPLQLLVAVYGSSNHPHYQVAVSRVPGIESRFLRYADATIEIYDAQGKLTQIDNKGHKTNLSYNRRAQLTTVADQYGHFLTFQYNANGNISNVTTSNGEAFAYAYDSSDNLVQVVFPQLNGATESKTYHYENASLPNHLTGISDENGDRYSSYAYDLNGLVISSEHATTSNNQAQHHYAFDYDGAETTVTDPAGTDVKWLFAKNKGYNNVLEKQYVADDKGLVQLFDAQNNLLTRTDPEGRVTTYVYNANRQRIRIVEATGTLEERTTDIEYFSPDIDLITEVTSPSVYGAESKTLTLNYNDQFNVIAQSVSGFKKSGAVVTRTTQFEYNDRGQLTVIDGPRTDVQDLTQFEYRDCIGGAGCGDLLSITNAIGHVVSFDQYDANGRITMMTDANGLVSTYQYHPRGWVLSVTQTPPSGDARVVRYHYDGIGQLSKIEMPDGAELSYTYDAAHELRQVTDNLGNRVEYAYDVKGNLVSEAVYGADNSLVKDAALAYDIRDFVESINTSGSITSLVTDAVGNVSRTTDPKQNPDTSHSFDNLNRLTQTIDALTNTTAYQYNVADQLTQVSAPNGAVTQYQYDDLGNQTQETSADRGLVVYAHDEAGNVTSMTDARGITTSYQYDALNRLTSVGYPDISENINYTYDSCALGLGRLCGLTDQAGDRQYAYNAYGNALQEIRTELGISYLTNYQYDAANRITQSLYPDGRRVVYERDAIGRITGVDTQVGETPLANIISNRVYRADGLTTGQIYGNSLIETRSYDQQGRLTSLNVGALGQHSYQYDANGNLTLRQPNSESYGYDPLDRLVNETRGSVINWTYDANGNRESEELNGQTSLLTYQSNSNRLQINSGLTITRDAAGNTLSDGQRSYTYNNAGRLVTINQAGQLLATYTYNADGQRRRKETSQPASITAYHYDLQGNLIGESNEGGLFRTGYVYLNSNPIAVYQHGEASGPQNGGDGDDPNADPIDPSEDPTDPVEDNGRDGSSGTGNTGGGGSSTCDGTENNGRDGPAPSCPPADESGTEEGAAANEDPLPDEDDGSGEFPTEDQEQIEANRYAPSESLEGLYYIHTDHINTPRWVSNAHATLIWSWASEAFGSSPPNDDADSDGEAFTLNHRFPGQYYDAESGLHYNWNRYYDASTGRYVTSDPIGLYGGLNTYGYVHENPLRYIDPKGLDIWIEGPTGYEPSLHQSVNVGDPNGRYSSYSYGVNGNFLQGEVYPDTAKGGTIEAFKKTTAAQNEAFKKLLDSKLRSTSIYGWDDTCRTWSQEQFSNAPGVPGTAPPRAWKPQSRGTGLSSSTGATTSGGATSTSGSSNSSTSR